MRTVIFLALCTAALGQEPETHASVTGRIVNASTGDPVRGARIYLDRQSAPPAYFLAETDSHGVFDAVGLDPGVYKLTVERSGFTSIAQRGTITLNPGQRLANSDFRMEAEGILSGRVVDADGDPVSYATVTVLRRGYIEGVATLRQVTAANMVLRADDKGEFRVFGLPGGKYYLRVGQPVTEIARTPAANTYYGNTASSADARPIDVSPGRTIDNLEVRLVTEQTSSVSGRVENRTGASAQIGAVLISPDGARLTGLTKKDGEFKISGVPPGAYTLFAAMSPPSGEYFVASQELTVGTQSVEGMSLVLLPTVKLGGKISAADGIEVKGIEVRVDVHGTPAPLPLANAAVHPATDGTFEFPKLSRGMYDLSLTGLPKGVYLKSVQIEDLDLTTNHLTLKADETGPIQIVLAKGAPSLRGSTDAGAKVVLVPDGAERRARKSLYSVTQAGPDGSFSLQGMPPGAYKLFAWEEVENTAWRNPEFLKDYEEAAVPIFLEAGSEARVDIRAAHR